MLEVSLLKFIGSKFRRNKMKYHLTECITDTLNPLISESVMATSLDSNNIMKKIIYQQL